MKVLYPQDRESTSLKHVAVLTHLTTDRYARNSLPIRKPIRFTMHSDTRSTYQNESFVFRLGSLNPHLMTKSSDSLLRARGRPTSRGAHDARGLLSSQGFGRFKDSGCSAMGRTANDGLLGLIAKLGSNIQVNANSKPSGTSAVTSHYECCLAENIQSLFDLKRCNALAVFVAL